MSVKVRFAPSPTGLLHIGNARTAIITWLFARNQGGELLLRIDDTDLERSKDEYIQAIKDDMSWLGLDWDELEHQRNRLERYDVAIQQLKDSGRLYPCYETPTELELKRKSLLSRSLPPIYDRGSLDLTPEEIKAYEEEGRKPHWRFKMNHDPIEWNDLVRGEVRFHGKDLSDPVLIREDGSPLYHICSVIDDIDFGITHVIRGEDHVSNTASHVQMFEALGGKVPAFAHLPLLSDAQGGKLSKRLGSASLSAMRDEDGVEPMAINSLLARLGTSDAIEAFSSLQPLTDGFDFAKFSKGAPKCDIEELYRLNAKIVHDLSFAEVQERLKDENLDQNVTQDYWRAVRPNLTRFNDLHDWLKVTNGPVQPNVDEADYDYIALAYSLIPEGTWDESTWGNWVAAIKEKTDRKGKALFMPLRQALTGMDHGPELDKMLPLIGPDKAKERLSLTAKAA